MPRSNRSRRASASARPHEEPDLSHVLHGFSHTVTKRDGVWHVQDVPAASALKYYTCPGCGLEVAPGMGHVVSWRADGLMGEADDIAGRRHWHSHCWKIA